MTDNQGLLTRVTTSLPFDDPFPNTTLQADWDVTNKIVHSIRQLGITQDDSIYYAALPLNAQLNVDANAEAGTYQHTYPVQRPLIPRLPSNRAQLNINGKLSRQSSRKGFAKHSLCHPT
jgi:hypothetical protein